MRSECHSDAQLRSRIQSVSRHRPESNTASPWIWSESPSFGRASHSSAGPCQAWPNRPQTQSSPAQVCPNAPPIWSTIAFLDVAGLGDRKVVTPGFWHDVLGVVVSVAGAPVHAGRRRENGGSVLWARLRSQCCLSTSRLAWLYGSGTWPHMARRPRRSVASALFVWFFLVLVLFAGWVRGTVSRCSHAWSSSVTCWGPSS